MKKKDTQEAHLTAWAKLLKVVQENEAGLAGIGPFRQALEKAHQEALTHRRVRSAMRASAQAATKRLHVSLAEGKDAAISLRSVVRGVLGPRSEKLRLYGIAPCCKRPKAARKPAAGA